MSFIEVDFGSTKSLVWLAFAVGVVFLIWLMATWAAVALGAVILGVALIIVYYAIVKIDLWAKGGLR